MPQRHDHDAGGDPEVLAHERALRPSIIDMAVPRLAEDRR